MLHTDVELTEKHSCRYTYSAYPCKGCGQSLRTAVVDSLESATVNVTIIEDQKDWILNGHGYNVEELPRFAEEY